MKLIIPLILANALSAFAQGTVIFDNNVPDIVVSRVYLSDPRGFPRWGNGPTDFPPGTTDWSDLVPLRGDSWSAQLYAAPGANVPWDSLSPASPFTYFKTAEEEAGFLIPMIATLAGVPADSPVATLQLRVWNNHGGSATTWEDAHYIGDPITVGESLPFNVYNIGGALNAPPALEGLVSFSGMSYVLIPEPSTFALFGLGAAALLIRGCRRPRKE